MICSKGVYKDLASMGIYNPNYQVIFPDKQGISDFFSSRNLLSFFSQEEKNMSFQALEGTTQSALGVTDALQRSITTVKNSPTHLKNKNINVIEAVDRIFKTPSSCEGLKTNLVHLSDLIV